MKPPVKLDQPHVDTVAIVTGGSQGVGHAIATRLIADGCRRMVIAGRDNKKGVTAAKSLSQTGADVRFVQVDMADAVQAQGMVDACVDAFGQATALVNAAGLSNRGGILDTDPALWDKLIGVNAKGPFFALQRLATLARANRHSATCVTVLSTAAHVGQSFLAPYSASKATMANITKNAAMALRSDGIRVNAIAPGWMDTEGEDVVQKKWHGADDNWLAKAEAEQPLGMLVKPAHLAALASYMLGPESGVMTGSVVDFDQFVPGAYPE
ncbi:MAG: SDR family oxidoreductase [Paracoccaceae bacterium]